MEIRLQKYLADAGIASRRASEKLIEEGKIKVNGQVITTQGVKINPLLDLVEYMGKRVQIQGTLTYYMLNKPVRCVTTASDEKNRKTVLDIVKVKERVFPIGRLDYMSSGLLLLTNDGDLTYKLTHPKHNIDKKYVAIIEPKITQDKINILSKGVDLGLFKTSPCKIKLLRENDTCQTYEVMIHEGKNRQVRRMFEYVQAKVIKLKRVSIGKLQIGDLRVGQYRVLTKEEIKYLKNL